MTDNGVLPTDTLLVELHRACQKQRRRMRNLLAKSNGRETQEVRICKEEIAALQRELTGNTPRWTGGDPIITTSLVVRLRGA